MILDFMDIGKPLIKVFHQVQLHEKNHENALFPQPQTLIPMKKIDPQYTIFEI